MRRTGRDVGRVIVRLIYAVECIFLILVILVFWIFSPRGPSAVRETGCDICILFRNGDPRQDSIGGSWSTLLQRKGGTIGRGTPPKAGAVKVRGGKAEWGDKNKRGFLR